MAAAALQAYLALVLILVVCQALGQERPTIGFISPDAVSDIGGTVELTCTIKNGHEYPILWMRLVSKGNNNTLPISTGSNLFVRDTRFALDYEPDAGSYKLTINDVVKSDEGRYQCQVVADLINVITADVDLKVKVPPVMNNETEPLVMAEVGKVAELTCEADGFPSPKIIWKKQDGTLLPNGDESYTNGKMVVSKVKREDRGIYVCTAENGVGANQDRVITFQVGFSPNIEVPKPRVPQAPYYEVHLVCLIQAYPPPAIQWIKNDEHLKNGANHLITHFASADDLTTSTLKIYSVSEDDYGKYSCDAANRYGSAVQHMEVYKSTMPICPPLCGDTDLNAGAAKGHSISLILAIATTILCLNL